MSTFPTDIPSGRQSGEIGDSGLVTESEFLLGELELAYRQLETLLVESEKETAVTYGELQDRNSRLEKQVSELQKAHGELKESQNHLAHSNRLAAMGQLAASIVHEIKNPLTIICLSIQLLLSKRKHGDWELQKLNDVLKQTRRLKDLADNMLSLSRKQVPKISPTNINTVLEELLAFLDKVKYKNTRIKTAFDEHLPRTYADPNQIQQVFMNLVMNAFDAMSAGGLLTVTTKVVDRASIFEGEAPSLDLGNKGIKHAFPLDSWNGLSQGVAHFICVEISDSGGGIPKEKLENIFEPFFSTKSEDKGTGLGLTISRDIIDKHTGNIAVMSSPGEGSTFSVFLPVRLEPSQT
jgi:signal transduction histidine kinase